MRWKNLHRNPPEETCVVVLSGSDRPRYAQDYILADYLYDESGEDEDVLFVPATGSYVRYKRTHEPPMLYLVL